MVRSARSWSGEGALWRWSVTKGGWKLLKPGDVLRNKSSKRCYMVQFVRPGRPKQVVLVRVTQASDPEQWEKVMKIDVEKMWGDK